MFMRAVLVCVLVAGCGFFDTETIQRLTNLSPLEDDPADYEVVVDLPEGLDIRPGGARFTLAAEHVDTRAVSQATYVLARRESQDGRILFRIAESDLNRLRGQQALIREWEDETNGRTQGQFGMDVDACKSGSGPDLNAPFTVSLIAEPGGAPRRLVGPTPVGQILTVVERDKLLLADCFARSDEEAG